MSTLMDSSVMKRVHTSPAGSDSKSAGDSAHLKVSDDEANFSDSCPEIKQQVLVSARKQHRVFHASLVAPDSYEQERHFYPRVLNASLSPQVAMFMQLGNERIALRYCHLHPQANYKELLALLKSRPQLFEWSGADLFNVTNHYGQRQMIIVETNSCPSGQKSMPLLHHNDDNQNKSGYHEFMRLTFQTAHNRAQAANKLVEGALAVVYDKNPMENTGYAAAMADVFNEPVFIAEFHQDDPDPPVKFLDKVMYVRDAERKWHPIRAAFRYVTQAPWTRIPVSTRTLILNPIASCLAGGRNKMVADAAYEAFNAKYQQFGLRIRKPQTIRDVLKPDIPKLVEKMGGHAVVKIPYSNAGQGVFTITSQRELDEFMNHQEHYDKYIVQSLVGNASWSSIDDTIQNHTGLDSISNKYYHTGTVPNKHKQIYVTDVRMQVCACDQGFQPVGIYARRAGLPLTDTLNEKSDSWGMLGTNLSVKQQDGAWATESERLLLMDLKDWNKLGLGIDDLIDGYVQTVLATTAIDQMAQRLIKEDGEFHVELFQSLNRDDALLSEIIP